MSFEGIQAFFGDGAIGTFKWPDFLAADKGRRTRLLRHYELERDEIEFMARTPAEK